MSKVLPMDVQHKSGEQQRSLVKKLATIMNKVGYIQKNGFNQQHNYSYVTESDVVNKIRPLFAEHNLALVPSVDKITVQEYKTKNGTTMFLTSVEMTFTLIDGDSGETVVFKMAGQGQDPGDKGVYKALTGCQKYALLKLLQIETGDDPERDEDGHQTSPQQNQDHHPAKEKGETGQRNGKQQGKQSRSSRKQGYGSTKEVEAPDYHVAKATADLLGWTTDQMMKFANNILKKHGRPTVKKWNDIQPNARNYIHNAMKQLLSQDIDNGLR